jgi:Flp pilus assembly protein TadD
LPAVKRHRYTALAVCGLLLLAVDLVFGQTARFEFVYDDGIYLCENPRVAHGLTIKGVTWALTSTHANNWHPLTWFSHMLDCQLYGLRWPGGHHLTNVLLHAANSILLFLVLRRMTGDLWPSGFAAALFAIHPLHVESVAWVAERKDMLSGLFFLLTLAAYVGYVRRPFSLLRYLLVAALFALGLMAKPMLVTLPCVLLLLDYWPLGRYSPPFMRLVAEKLPLLALAGLSCAVTPLAQGQAVQSWEFMPLSARLANALVSYAVYLGQLFCPLGLAAFYPHPGTAIPLWQIVGALLLLAGIFAVALAIRRRCPYLLVGWLWYVGMLVPVIGIVQVGQQARADRYTYLTQIGLYVALVWGAAHVSRRWSHRRWVCTAGSTVVLLLLAVGASRQTSFWRDSETLWTRALACTSRNAAAHNNLGMTLVSGGQIDEGIAHYQKSLEIDPDDIEAHNNLGVALMERGQVDEAIGHYRRALQLKPDFTDAHNNLGNALASRGRKEEAITEYRKALESTPDDTHVRNNLGVALAGRGQVDAAIAEYRQAVEIKPDYADAHHNLGLALARRGEVAAAIAEHQKALEIDPGDCVACYNLARILATHPTPGFRDGAAAVALAQRGVTLLPDDPAMLSILAAAYAEAGRFPEAVRTAEKAGRLAASAGNRTLASQIHARLELYKSGKPCRQPPS